MKKNETIKEAQEGLAKDHVEQSLNHLKKAMDFYQAPREEDELDLVKEVRDRLFSLGVSEERLQKTYDQNPLVQEANGRHAHAQQFQMTRYLNEQFLIAQVNDGVDTALDRYQLMFEVKPTEWLQIFDQGLSKNFLEMDLPRTIDNER